MNSVYFAKFGDYVKIGFSSNPRKRLEEIARPGEHIDRPDGFDAAAVGELVMVIPFCRMRDERNMQLLYAHHWSGTGEWFRWSPAFRYQMETMQFVTHAARMTYLRQTRRDLGIVGVAVKEWRWGKQTPEILAETLARVESERAAS